MRRYWLLCGISAAAADSGMSTSLQEQLYQKIAKSHKERVFTYK